MRKIVVLTAFLLLAAVPALAQPTLAGSVKNVSGQAVVVRDGQEIQAVEGMRLFESDTLRTGSDSALGVYLRDDTVLSFGPNTEVKLETFLFDPIDENFSLSIRVFQGTAAYLSGAIGRLAPDSIQVVTPEAILGVRGTHFLVEVR